MQHREITIPLNDLGMDEKAMLELVNRLNEHDDRKWVFVRGQGCGQMLNPLIGNPYASQMFNQAILQ